MQIQTLNYLISRLNAKALSLFDFASLYQKKHLVEILSYHSCDSQTRNAPELDLPYQTRL